MQKYLVKGYCPGVEPDQARIGIEVACNWIWPYAYDLDDLLKAHAQPDFDPTTRYYCYLGDEVVGYLFYQVMPAGEGETLAATLEFPRMSPGHEPAAGLLLDRAFETLKARGVSRVVGRVTTMCPGDIQLAESSGFSIHDWGYKVYYSYAMERGELAVPGDAAEEVDPQADLKDYARIAARWYLRPPEWCRTRLEEMISWGVITHLAVREQGSLVAACLAAPNVLRPSTAAIHYIYAPEARSLKPMLAVVVSRCIAAGVHNVIADLVNEHRQYEPVYQELGFEKVAEWALCEKRLD
jgi:hypothetical protein